MSARNVPVARYYDSNTRRFLRFGGGAASGSIHRLLWGAGVGSAGAAAGYVHELIERALRAARIGAGATLLDLGCGVGGTALHLARAFPGARLHGVTVSRAQMEIATRAAAAAGLAERCRFDLGDFESMRFGFVAEGAVAVEAYAHSRRPDAFFATAAAHLRPGGSLLVVDDFLRGEEARLPETGRRGVHDFKRGWRVPGFATVSGCVSTARRHGFEAVEERDLTHLIRLDRARDHAVAALAPVVAALGLARVPFFGNLVGGNALRRGLGDGHFAYRWLAFRRNAEGVSPSSGGLR